MTNIKGIVIAMLLFTLVMGGGTFLIADFGGGDIDLMGDTTIDEKTLNQTMTDISEKVEGISEDSSVLTGVTGIIGVIKEFIRMPAYAAKLLGNSFSYFGIPGIIGVTAGLILLFIVVYELVLLLRGVAK